jgi:hypothetical protein
MFLGDMNKRGFVKEIVMLVLIFVICLLYFYTEPTKDVIGMLVSDFDAVDFDNSNGTVTVQLANASELAHKVVLQAAEKAAEVSGNDSISENSTAEDT